MEIIVLYVIFKELLNTTEIHINNIDTFICFIQFGKCLHTSHGHTSVNYALGNTTLVIKENELALS